MDECDADAACGSVLARDDASGEPVAHGLGAAVCTDGEFHTPEAGTWSYAKRFAADEGRCRNDPYIVPHNVECLPASELVAEWQRYGAARAEQGQRFAAAGLGDGLDVLLIDVEGWDLEVIKTLGLSPGDPRVGGVSPWIVVFEAEHLSAADHARAKEILAGAGYVVWDLLEGDGARSAVNTVAVLDPGLLGVGGQRR
uniref:Methyltransferase FkbM domain-containing protein n=2 Tax=Phaeomonas parva TaxID=124430 RepID=A0A7S1UJK5_9STRA|mmetsp:Transcript_8550/g.24697  ORF Transcript_8550/g.24697 Transcript_8550/m.24697 type:complete len:198 (+) Transcript_8550:225-818(+)